MKFRLLTSAVIYCLCAWTVAAIAQSSDQERKDEIQVSTPYKGAVITVTNSSPARDSLYGPYLADLKRRIKRAWFPPKGDETKRVVVVFRIHSLGELSNLRLDHSSGVAAADQAALKAVENASPFRMLPKGGLDELDIKFIFDYNLFSGGGSGLFRKF
jgi:TonB family protein